MKSESPPGTADRTATQYWRRLVIQAPPQVVFGAISTVHGPRHWWTTRVSGLAQPGGQLTFGFAGSQEEIVMHVDAVEPLRLVRWTCVAHNRDEEWTGSSLRFRLAKAGERLCELDFRHEGLAPELVATGWDHFLASLVAHVEHGRGTPFGA